VVAKGWYIAGLSRDIPAGKAKSFDVCGQRIVVFRGEDRVVRALDAYCPHMGTDLGIGQVDGNSIRCFFHHWGFDGEGNCQDVPCQSAIPTKARLQSYATAEKYGFIWIYPDAIAPESVAEFDELQDQSIVVWHEKPLERRCHHHICMMNGIDAQHLQTVHKININMELSLQQNQSGSMIDFTLKGEFPSKTFREKIGRKILGATYEYSMRYADGCVGLLTMMKNLQFFPSLHMVFAYTAIAPGRTRIQPIYVAKRRPGILGWITTRLLLLFTRLSYYFLRDEDGKIYDNIQFNPNLLLGIDAPIAKYMNYVNQLEPSIWSKCFINPKQPKP
jgi:phenylpropionate dioxygenase-like ring-hydroxylating dioxygenase large terminal subunit